MKNKILKTIKEGENENKREVYLIRSETFFGDNKLEDIQRVLDEAINDFVEKERIINIEVKESSGMLRFWIYLEKKN